MRTSLASCSSRSNAATGISLNSCPRRQAARRTDRRATERDWPQRTTASASLEEMRPAMWPSGANGSAPPGPSDGCVGIIANPMSGRDIRRLTARASVFPNTEKTNMVLRLIAAAGALGVHRVLVSTDSFGIAAAVLRACQRLPNRSRSSWPDVQFCELDCQTGTAEDTRALVRQFRARGAGVIVLLGGDGTVRAAAPDLGDTPMLPLST